MPIIKTDKESIIRNAIRLFKLHGYYSTTMSKISAACGLIKGSIYHHFESKEALGIACLQSIRTHFDTHIFSIAKDHKLEDVQKLKRFTNKVEEYFLNSEGGCLLGNFALEVANDLPVFKTEIERYFHDWETALGVIFQPTFGKAAARDQASEIVASTQGEIMMMRLSGQARNFKKLNKRISCLLE